MKKHNFLALLCGMVFCGIGLILGGQSASAANVTMTVSPMSQRIILVPGETYYGTINVTNPLSSEADLIYTSSVASFNMSGDEYENIDLTSTGSYNQIVDWIRIVDGEGTVSPNGTKTITFAIDVPTDAPAGGQYASIRISNKSDNNAAEGSISVNEYVDVASVIYASVAGETVESGEVVENNIPSVVLSAPLEVSSIVKNDGNVHTDAEYSLQVWSLFSDEEIFTNEESPSNAVIMPESSRANKVTWQNIPLFGIYRVRQTIMLFGESSFVEKYVLFCPLWLFAIIIFAVFGTIAWLVTKSKSRKKKSRR